MKTLEEITLWLKEDNKLPVILAEIDDTPVLPMRLSTKPYVTLPTDTLVSTHYTPCIVGGVSFTESMSLDGSVSISYGDIEIDNTGGRFDSWLDYVWTNKVIQLYIGDVSWSRDDFYMIFSGVVSDISSRSNNLLNIIIVNKLQKLNNPISEEKLPSINTNSDVLIPVTFGEVFNVTPVATDTVVNTLEYQVHTGAIEDIIEVRDNGIPVSFTKDLANGKFTLNQSPYGQITCSVQGHKDPTYVNNIADIIKEIVTKYGPANSRLTDYDIDLSNFGTFAASNTQVVGTFLSGSENLLATCNELADSIGAQLTFSSLGYLRLVKLALPATGTAYTIEPKDFQSKSISVVSKSEVRAATKLGYCKNWATQVGSLAAGIPSNNTQLFESEWLYESALDATVQSDYKLTSEPKEEHSLLVEKTAAQAEVLRRNNLWKSPRYIYTLRAYSYLLGVELGDSITLIDSRFGLDSGKTGLAISVARDWISGIITIGVLV